jgi:hypothetical protein
MRIRAEGPDRRQEEAVKELSNSEENESLETME